MDNWFCPRAPSPRREQAVACHNPCPCMGRAQGHAAPEGDIMGCSDPKNEEGVETLGKGTKEAQRSRRTLGVQGPLWPPGDTLVPVAAWCWESSGDTWWLWGPPAAQLGCGRSVSPVSLSPPQGISPGGDVAQAGRWQCHPRSPGFGKGRDTGLQGDPPGCHRVPGTLPWRKPRWGQRLAGAERAFLCRRGWQGTGTGTGTGTETRLAPPPALCPHHLPFIPLPLPPARPGHLGPLHRTGGLPGDRGDIRPLLLSICHHLYSHPLLLYDCPSVCPSVSSIHPSSPSFFSIHSFIRLLHFLSLFSSIHPLLHLLLPPSSIHPSPSSIHLLPPSSPSIIHFSIFFIHSSIHLLPPLHPFIIHLYVFSIHPSIHPSSPPSSSSSPSITHPSIFSTCQSPFFPPPLYSTLPPSPPDPPCPLLTPCPLIPR